MKVIYLFLTIFTVLVAFALFLSLPVTTSPQTKDICYPSEYQLVIENDSLMVSDNGRYIKTIHLSSTGELENVLIQDNE